MTVQKIVWRNRLLAVVTTNDSEKNLHDCHPITQTHGAEWMSKIEEENFLARKVEYEHPNGQVELINNEMLIALKLRKRFAQQKKNPDWIEEFLSGGEITAPKNGNRYDPRLDGVYTGQPEGEPDPEPVATKEPELPKVTVEQLKKLNNDQLITMCVELKVIGWSSRDSKDALVEKLAGHLGLEMPDPETEDPDAKTEE